MNAFSFSLHPIHEVSFSTKRLNVVFELLSVMPTSTIHFFCCELVTFVTSSLIHLMLESSLLETFPMLFKSGLKFSFTLTPNGNWREYMKSILKLLPTVPNNVISWFPYILKPYIASFLCLHLHCKCFSWGTITLLLFAPCLKQ